MEMTRKGMRVYLSVLAMVFQIVFHLLLILLVLEDKDDDDVVFPLDFSPAVAWRRNKDGGNRELQYRWGRRSKVDDTTLPPQNEEVVYE